MTATTCRTTRKPALRTTRKPALRTSRHALKHRCHGIAAAFAGTAPTAEIIESKATSDGALHLQG